jgi:hypothetical protein
MSVRACEESLESTDDFAGSTDASATNVSILQRVMDIIDPPAWPKPLRRGEGPPALPEPPKKQIGFQACPSKPQERSRVKEGIARYLVRRKKTAG